MQMIRSGDNRKTQLLSQLDQKFFFSAGRFLDDSTVTSVNTCSLHARVENSAIAYLHDMLFQHDGCAGRKKFFFSPIYLVKESVGVG